MFTPVQGYAWYGYIIGAFLLTGILIAALMAIPPRYRRHVILTVTFLGGLFYAIEFFWPTRSAPTPENPEHVANFLTPFVASFANFATVVSGWTVGLGAINLCQVHGKRLFRGASGWFNSLTFFVSMIAMMVVGILQQAHPNLINKNLNSLLYDGGLQTLDATMFSLIAFYITSAAYRAFRVRSVEATLLLVTAVVVMLGQVAVGQLITSGLSEEGFARNFRLENIRDWIMTKANTPATRAIVFGLGIGNLAVALRIWLGLERGSYFESQR